MNRKYTKEKLEEVVKECLSWRQVILALSLRECGGNYKNLQNRCKEYNIDVSHFHGQGWNKPGHPSYGKMISLEERLSVHNSKIPAHKTKEILFNHNLKENKCEKCGIKEWNGKPITLELHHINGNPKDDRLENLQILCPNCHSQTFNYCKRKELLIK